MTYISEGCYDLTGYAPDEMRQNDESLKTLILPEEIILPEYRGSSGAGRHMGLAC